MYLYLFVVPGRPILNRLGQWGHSGVGWALMGHFGTCIVCQHRARHAVCATLGIFCFAKMLVKIEADIIVLPKRKKRKREVF